MERHRLLLEEGKLMAMICPNCGSQDVVENVAQLHCLACDAKFSHETQNAQEESRAGTTGRR